MVSATLLGVSLAVLAAAGLAVQSLAVRLGTETRTVPEVIAAMFALNLLVLVPVTAVVAYPAYAISARALGAFVVAGLLGSLAARYCYFVGIARLGASRTEPLKALFPLFAVGTAILVLGERATPTLLAGVVLLVLGGAAVTLEARANPNAPTGRALGVALAFPLTAALLLGVDPVFTKIGLSTGVSSLLGVTVRVAAAAAGFGLYLAWRTVRTGRVGIRLPNRWVVVASVANTGYLLAYYAALARAPVAVVTPVLSLSTLFVVVGALLFVQREERVTGRLLGAAAVVVAGVVLVVQG